MHGVNFAKWAGVKI